MVTDVVDGDSLEAALRDYGPAAIEDLLPRLRAIAEILDAAHASGQVHGRLHPQNIFVSADQTQVHGLDETTAAADQPARPPYAAPEIAAGGPAQPAADQFSLGAIAFEWMFGRRISGPAVRPIEVRALPGVDRAALARAFTRALAPQPADRFASCLAFCQALEAAVIPVLPLGGAVDEDEDVLETGFLPEPTPASPIDLDELEPVAAAVPVLEEKEETPLESFEPRLSPPVEPVTSWQPSAAYTPAKPAERFSGGMLIAACLVGMVVGFAAGYMARPRALQTRPIQTMAAPSNGTEAAVSAPVAAAPVEGPAEAAPQGNPKKGLPPPVEVNAGRLLIRSTPSGASVAVDGVARGVTPLALRDLELGSRRVAITRRGYIAEEQRVVLTRARPSRTLEVQLTPSASAAAGRSGVTLPKPAGSPAGVGGAAMTGGLLVESRPPGATVTVNGTNRGTTPLTIEALAPGSYRVGLSLAGYQSFATTVRVVAGERARAAASLSVQE
ncbi:MAG: PEGA domain-containing protein [Acidobacteriota bacterium]|nr:PEGA domain-containing protein [Acidobacteriota bacterium]